MPIEKCLIGAWEGELNYGDDHCKALRTELIPLNDERLVVLYGSRSDDKYPYAVICGYHRNKERTENGLQTIDVETIPKRQKEEIERLMRERGYEGNLSFWD